jgi:hypothetical protein
MLRAPKGGSHLGDPAIYAGFEVLTAVTIRGTSFSNMTPSVTTQRTASIFKVEE